MLKLWKTAYDLFLPFNCIFDHPTPAYLEQEIKSRIPPDLPLEIWLEIFQFATYVYRDVSIKPLNPFTPKHTTTNVMGVNTPSSAMRTKLALVRVSRAWKRVAMQILYHHVVIRSPHRADIILRTMKNSQSLDASSLEIDEQSGAMSGYGKHVRHIEVLTYTRGSKDIRFLQTVFQILRHCPSLKMFSARWTHPLPIEFLNGISAFLGPTLSELYWNERRSHANENTNTNLNFFSSFQSLRVLDLRHFVGIKPSSWPECGSSLCLPLVQSLVLSSHPRSLEAGARFRMPTLRNLTLINSGWNDNSHHLLNTFLKAHGNSLLMIDLPTNSTDSELDPENPISDAGRTNPHINPDIFLAPDICPNLEVLVFSVTSPNMRPYAHPNIRRIGLRSVHVEGLYPEKSSTTKDHFMAFNIDRYPRLELIQTVNFLVEANSDSIAKDLFIWWVEHFESMGVLFLDGEAVMWAYHSETTYEPERLADSTTSNNIVAISNAASNSPPSLKAAIIDVAGSQKQWESGLQSDTHSLVPLS